MTPVGKLLFSKDHEWVRFGDGTARVGITDFAQDALGDVVFVQLPSVGSRVTAGDSISEIESTKSVSDIYAPVSGTITSVNALLENEPHLVNTDPLGEGWIYEMSVDSSTDFDHLMDEAAYRQLVKG